MMLEVNTLYRMDWQELMSELEPQSVDLILTDIPYGSDAQKDTATNLRWDVRPILEQWWLHVRRVLNPKGVVVMTSQQPLTTDLIIGCRDWFRYSLVWQKTMAVGFLDANRMPLRSHEDILVFSPVGRGSHTYNPQKTTGHSPFRSLRNGRTTVSHYSTPRVDGINTDGSRYPTSVLTFAHDVETWARGSYKLHPTQKPLGLFEWIVKSYSNEGDLVVDPFIGSGTTAVACKLNGRNYIGGDLDEGYLEIARQRLNPTFGDKPKPKRESRPLSDLPLFADLD